jgi:hypothetical protein
VVHSCDMVKPIVSVFTDGVIETVDVSCFPNCLIR